jgi:hypothetical protein
MLLLTEKRMEAMKLSFWDILASMVMLAGLAISTVFINIYINPHSFINPFPPSTPVATLIVPTLTGTPQFLPDLWTTTPETPVSGNIKVALSSATPTLFGTHFVLPSYTPTRTRTASPTVTRTITSTPNRTLAAEENKTATKTATSASKTTAPTSSLPACSTTSGYCDDANPSVTYTGNWQVYKGSGPYNNTSHYSATAGSTASFSFSGSKITYMFPSYTNRGNAKISIDGSDVATVNLYSDILLWQQMWESNTLSDSSHIITVTVLDGTVDLDAFIIERSGPALTNTPMPPDTTDPVNPSSVSETNGIHDNTWQNDFNTPTFTWPAGTDTGTGVSHYLVYFGTDETAVPTSVQISPYSPGVQTAGTYFLRLITVDNAGNQSDPETMFTFKFDNVPPANPPGVTEVNGVAQNTWQKEHDTPNFSLTAPGTDANSGVGGYLVYFGNDSEGIPVSSETFEYSPGQQDSGTYYLRVITLDNSGNQSKDIKTLFTYKLDKTPPTDPDSLVTTDPASDSTPTFTWDVATDEHSGMGSGAGYQVEWDAIGTCDNVVTNFDDANSFTAPSPIPAGTPYFICVRAVDALGNTGDWVGPTSHTYTP